MTPIDPLKNISRLIPSNYLDAGVESPLQQCIEGESETEAPIFHVDLLQQQHLLDKGLPQVQALFRSSLEIETVESEMTSETILTELLDPELGPQWLENELQDINDLKAELGNLSDGDPAIVKAMLDELEILGTQYFILAQNIQNDPEGTEKTFEDLNQLSREVFLTLSSYSTMQKDENLQIQAHFYQGYLEMARGDLSMALVEFEFYQQLAFKQIGDGNTKQGENHYRNHSGLKTTDSNSILNPQEQKTADKLYYYNQDSYKANEEQVDFFKTSLVKIDGIQEQIEQDREASLALFYLNVWETVAKDVWRKKIDESEGLLGETLTLFEETFSDETTIEGIQDRFAMEMANIANLRSKLINREAVTLAEAEALVESSALVYDDDYQALIDYIIYDPDRSAATQEFQAKELLQMANLMEARHDLPQSAYAIYSLLGLTESENSIGEGAQAGRDSLEGNASVYRGISNFLMGFTSDELLTDGVLLMLGLGVRNAATATVGNLLTNGDKISKSASLLAWGAGVITDATFLTGYQFLTASLDSNPEKVWTWDNFQKSGFGNLILLGFARGAGKLGSQADKYLKVNNPTIEKQAAILGVIAGRNVNEEIGLWEESYGGEWYSIGQDLGKFFRSWGAGNFLKKTFPKYKKYIDSSTTDAGSSEPSGYQSSELGQ